MLGHDEEIQTTNNYIKNTSLKTFLNWIVDEEEGKKLAKTHNLNSDFTKTNVYINETSTDFLNDLSFKTIGYPNVELVFAKNVYMLFVVYKNIIVHKFEFDHDSKLSQYVDDSDKKLYRSKMKDFISESNNSDILQLLDYISDRNGLTDIDVYLERNSDGVISRIQIKNSNKPYIVVNTEIGIPYIIFKKGVIVLPN